MDQRGYFEPLEPSGSEIRPDALGLAARLSTWSRLAATRAASLDLVPAQRECSAAS